MIRKSLGSGLLFEILVLTLIGGSWQSYQLLDNFCFNLEHLTELVYDE